MSEPSHVFHKDQSACPAQIVHGDGVWLQDETGRRFLDGSSSASVVAIGHGRTEIYEALAEAGQRVPFVYSASFTHRWQEELATGLIEMAPPPLSSVYFASGGSEAIETAWKLARQYFVETDRPQKYKAIARWQSYHGVTLAALSLSGRTSWRGIYSPLLPPVSHIAPAYEYRCAFCEHADQCTLACADELERTILLEGPETVAAFFAEPVSGTSISGVVPNQRYFKRIREICDKYDVLFVADEVLCGYGRTGRPYAITAFDVAPDMLTLGKGIASGYAPLAATLVSEKLREGIRGGSGKFVHGLTYSGTPSATFIGLQVQKIMQSENLFHRAAELEPFLCGALNELAEKHEIIGEIRGRGLLFGVEFVADRKTRTPFHVADQVTQKVVSKMRENGVIVAAGIPLCNHGYNGDHIQISPPLVSTKDELGVIVGALDDALEWISPQLTSLSRSITP